MEKIEAWKTTEPEDTNAVEIRELTHAQLAQAGGAVGSNGLSAGKPGRPSLLPW
jgi:hypothetical protein